MNRQLSDWLTAQGTSPTMRFWLFWLVILSFCFVSVVQHVSAAEFDWVTDSQRLVWSSKGDASPSEWMIRGSEDSANGWFSIVNKDNEGEAISRHLSLAIPGLTAAVWRRVNAAEGLVHEAESDDGRFAVRKSITESEDDYRLDLTVEFINLNENRLALDKDIQLTLGPGLGEHPIDGLGIAETLYSFVQPMALSGGELERFRVNDQKDHRWQAVASHVDWGGLHSRYFALVLKPANADNHEFIFRATSDVETGYAPRYFPEAGYRFNIGSLAPGETRLLKYSLFAGPKSSSALHGDATDYTELLLPGLWEWMRGLGFGLLWSLEAIHQMVPSWGLAIVLLAIFVRILMYPVAKRALKSQAAFADVQKKIQPEMARIKREYRGGEQSEMLLELYKMHGVSPLAGLKPLLIVAIQIPIFIALFHVLGQAYELRDAGFLWIDTLAEPDRLFSLGVDLP